MVIEYIGLAEKAGDSYSVFFPDFPGFGRQVIPWKKRVKMPKRG